MKQLFMKTTDKDGKAHGGFQWPLEVGATVTAPDWEPTKECDNGLHGILNGEGGIGHLSFEPDALWWIVEADDAIDLDGRHKFQSCKIVAFGKREQITPMMRRMTGGAVDGLIETGADRSTLAGGACSILTGGYGSMLTGGNCSTLTGGDFSIITSVDGSTLTGGFGSIITGSARSNITGGHESTLTGGYGSTIVGGCGSTLMGGHESTLTSGIQSTLIFWRMVKLCRRAIVAHVGENGILPNKAYRANKDHTAVIPVEDKQ
jgi:hypothetical protein